MELREEKEAEEDRHLLLHGVTGCGISCGVIRLGKAKAQAQAERLLIEGQSAIECEYSVTCVCHTLCVNGIN